MFHLCLNMNARRYIIMTTNIAESMNALMKEAQEYPIIALLETSRTKLKSWFHDHLRIANNCTTVLTLYPDTKMGKRDDKSLHFMVHPIDEFRFYILDGQCDAIVDINLRTCTCNKFQLNLLLCSHAIWACRMRNICAYFAQDVNGIALYPQHVQDVVVRLLVLPNKKGRRKNKRMPSQGEETPRFHRCRRCREPCHNRECCIGKEYVPSQKP
ncbi:hypothetical protein LIER_14911 [Lithospermum erythrorhizon]|uniref:SWIM-type domain-containing protein n=1 Tax=Lithospermum erythrorhizon TaxID=34254 RepID=A0AAV3Q0U8_LITER